MSKIKPVIIKKNLIINDKKILQTCLNNITQEDIIYKASANDFLQGKFPNLVITNVLNKVKHSSRTIARYSSVNSTIVEITSDSVTRLIGQKNYETVFAALCSVINQKLRIEGILSLLTAFNSVDIKPEPQFVDKVNTSTQTHQTCMSMLMKEKRVKNYKRCRARPYVIKDTLQKSVKKVVVNPSNINLKKDLNIEKSFNIGNNTKDLLIDLKTIVDEDSNISTASVGKLSFTSDCVPGHILDYTESILDQIDKNTEHKKSQLELVDRLEVTHNTKVEDVFHLITEDTLMGMSQQDQQKLLIRQACVDFQYCVLRGEDGNLPLHNAVLQNDVNLLRRHCIMLKKRNEIVDIPGADHLSALQLAVLGDVPKCTQTLLEHGADALVTDDEGRSVFHLAAEAQPEHLSALIEFHKKNARQILKDNEDLWEADMEKKSDVALAEYLLHYISIMCDTQGYTPLMLASKLGLEENVKLLVETVPNTINKVMPNCGNTALYLAVGSACVDAENRGDKSTVASNFLKTIECLIVHGADPYLQNSSGSTVNDVLTECNISALSLLIANKLTSVKFFNGNEARNFDSYMLVKNAEGKVNIKELKRKFVIECPKQDITKGRLMINDGVTRNINDLTIKNENVEISPAVPLKRLTTTVTSQKIESEQLIKTTSKMETVNILRNVPVLTKIVPQTKIINKTNLVLIKCNKINSEINKIEPDGGAKKKIKIVTNSVGNACYNIELGDEFKMSTARTKKRESDVNIGASCSKKQKQ